MINQSPDTQNQQRLYLTWGGYLCRGPPSCYIQECHNGSEQVPATLARLVNRLEKALKGMGLTPFSCSVAVQFIKAQLLRGEQEKFRHVIAFLVSLLNQRVTVPSVSTSDPASDPASDAASAFKKTGSTRGAEEMTAKKDRSVFRDTEDSLSRARDSCSSSNTSDSRRCPQLIPGLRAQPFWDVSEFPWVRELERAFPDIRREFLALRARRFEPTHHANTANTAGGASDANTAGGTGGTGGTGESHTPVTSEESGREGSSSPVGFQHYRAPIHRQHKGFSCAADSGTLPISPPPAFEGDGTFTQATQPGGGDINIDMGNDSVGNDDGISPSSSPSNISSSDSLGKLATDHGDWNVCYFYLHGVDFSRNLALCPRTAEAIRAVPRHYHHALFSALAPDTHVIPHCGPTNKKLRCHLPLVVPAHPEDDLHPKCASQQGYEGSQYEVREGRSAGWLRVGAEGSAGGGWSERWLQEGRCVVFDDSFEHEAANMSRSQPRVVLIVDFWHPDLSDEEVRFFEFLNKAQIKAAQRISGSRTSASVPVTKVFKQQGVNDEGGSKAEATEDEDKRGDFFHVIEAARKAGISQADQRAIWG